MNGALTPVFLRTWVMPNPRAFVLANTNLWFESLDTDQVIHTGSHLERWTQPHILSQVQTQSDIKSGNTEEYGTSSIHKYADICVSCERSWVHLPHSESKAWDRISSYISLGIVIQMAHKSQRIENYCMVNCVSLQCHNYRIHHFLYGIFCPWNVRNWWQTHERYDLS